MLPFQRLLPVVMFLPLAVVGCGPSKTEVALQERSAQFEKQIVELKAKTIDMEAKTNALANDLTAKTARVAVLEEKLLEATTKATAAEATTKNIQAQLTARDAKLAALEAERVKTNEAAAIAEATAAKTAEVAAKAAAEEARRANLTLQLGLDFRSGDTKPVANAKVYLTRKPLDEIFPNGLPDSDGKIIPAWFAWQMITKYGSIFSKSTTPKLLLDGLGRETAYSATTDFTGRVAFEGIEPGTYYVLCSTPLGEGAVLEKQVSVKGKTNTVALNNEDLLRPIR